MPPLRRSAMNRLRCLAAASLLACASIAVGAEEAPRFTEAKVKAAFVFSFARYIEWPPHCFVPPETPFVIGVTSSSEFQEELKTIVKTRTLSGRTIEVREIRSPQDAASVHLLFIDRAEEKWLLSALTGLTGAGVVTVGESERFTEAGGMLTLHQRDDRLRFRVNRDAAQKTVVKLSSQLLKLAEPATAGS
jgi:hypothetical protein